MVIACIGLRARPEGSYVGALAPYAKASCELRTQRWVVQSPIMFVILCAVVAEWIFDKI